MAGKWLSQLCFCWDLFTGGKNKTLFSLAQIRMGVGRWNPWGIRELSQKWHKVSRQTFILTKPETYREHFSSTTSISRVVGMTRGDWQRLKCVLRNRGTLEKFLRDILAYTFYESLLLDSKLVFLILRTHKKLEISVSLINL